MSLEPALLAAVAASPDDDLPRLVYADWLDENGRPLRAEFIRLQIEIAKKETLPRAAVNVFSHLWKRQQEILDDHRDELLGPLAGVVGLHDAVFRRGFLERLVLLEYPRQEHFEHLSTFQPRPVVRVEEGALLLADLDDYHGIGVVTELVARRSFDGNFGGYVISSQLARAAPRLPRLAVLDLEDCRLGDDRVGQAFSVPFPALADLDLSFNDLTDAGVIALLNTGVPQRLKRLVLGGNPIGDEGAVALAEALASSLVLENLNLRMTNVGTVGRAALLGALGGKVDLF